MQHRIEPRPLVPGQAQTVRLFGLLELAECLQAQRQVVIRLRIARRQRQHLLELFGRSAVLLPTVIEYAELERGLRLGGGRFAGPHEKLLRLPGFTVPCRDLGKKHKGGRTSRMRLGEVGELALRIADATLGESGGRGCHRCLGPHARTRGGTDRDAGENSHQSNVPQRSPHRQPRVDSSVRLARSPCRFPGRVAAGPAHRGLVALTMLEAAHRSRPQRGFAHGGSARSTGGIGSRSGLAGGSGVRGLLVSASVLSAKQSLAAGLSFAGSTASAAWLVRPERQSRAGISERSLGRMAPSDVRFGMHKGSRQIPQPVEDLEETFLCAWIAGEILCYEDAQSSVAAELCTVARQAFALDIRRLGKGHLGTTHGGGQLGVGIGIAMVYALQPTISRQHEPAHSHNGRCAELAPTSRVRRSRGPERRAWPGVGTNCQRRPGA